jgi:hypothetical protein
MAFENDGGRGKSSEQEIERGRIGVGPGCIAVPSNFDEHALGLRSRENSFQKTRHLPVIGNARYFAVADGPAFSGGDGSLRGCDSHGFAYLFFVP